jgi:signal transduction histidine kinase
MQASKPQKTISQTLKRWAKLHTEALKDWRYWVVMLSIVALTLFRSVLEQIGMLFFIGDLFYIPLNLYWVPLMYCAWTFNLPVTVTSALFVLIVNGFYLILYTGTYFRLFEISQLLITATLSIVMGVLIAQKRAEEQKAKLFARRALDNREDERKRLSRDLHDDTIQSMALVCRQLDSVRYFSNELSPSAKEELLSARNNVEATVDRLRILATELRPSMLDDLGLVVSIRKLVNDLSQTQKINTHFDLVGKERRLPVDVEVGLFRITQEALRNVERHAKPTDVAVTLTFSRKEAELTVKDNGRGFNVPESFEELSSDRHLGILGMIEHAEQLGGRLHIDSGTGKGTTVTITIPLDSST